MNTFKKVIVFIFAIFLSGFGIALTTQADLGTTPISSLPYVLTFMSPLSFGTTTIIVNVLFLIIQIIVLKKEFKKFYYLQILVTLIFGMFIDLGMHLSAFFKTEIYVFQILMLVVGSFVMALGICLEVYSDFLYVPGEGVVKAFSYKYKKDFGKSKTFFDCSLCVISIVLCLVVLGKIQGLREGTIISAVLVGNFVSLINKTAKKLKNNKYNNM